MCGRYSLSSPADLVEDLFDLAEPLALEPRYNIAPTQEALVVREIGGRRRGERLGWGFHRAAQAADGPPRIINARSETVAEKPTFRDSFRRRRCLVPADGFYEWTRKQPYHFHLPGYEPFGFAGLWTTPPPGVEGPEVFTILTTAATERLASYHDRMPVILAPDAFPVWLDDSVEEPDLLREILARTRNEELEPQAVSTWVNRVANDAPRCVEPAEERQAEVQQSLFS